jgi:hypothetical protein
VVVVVTEVLVVAVVVLDVTVAVIVVDVRVNVDEVVAGVVAQLLLPM